MRPCHLLFPMLLLLTPGHALGGPVHLRIMDGAPQTTGAIPVAKVGNCTGTLVSPRQILSAAHCQQDSVLAGEVSIAGETIPIVDVTATETSEVSESIGTRKTPTLVFPDLQLITLETAVTRALPVPLLTRATVRKGQRLLIMGYGRTLGDRPDEGVLRYGYTRVTYTTSRFIYAKKTAWVGGTCSGDSGGPAFARVIRNGRPAWALLGVISQSIVPLNAADCVNGQTDLFVRLQHTEARRFLNRYYRKR